MNYKNKVTMATKKVYDACCRCIRQMNLHQIMGADSRKMTKPAMSFLFGKTELVTEKELMRCSESEKRRHLMEDYVLRCTYIELYAEVKFSIESPSMVCHTQNV